MQWHSCRTICISAGHSDVCFTHGWVDSCCKDGCVAEHCMAAPTVILMLPGGFKSVYVIGFARFCKTDRVLGCYWYL